MDMQRIQQKLLTNQYDSVEDMVADFVQMFDNACKYNEPESVIYKVSCYLFCLIISLPPLPRRLEVLDQEVLRSRSSRQFVMILFL